MSRPLKPDEIDLRVGRFTETKTNKVIAHMLLYKDARVDMALLDEMYPNKWKREHKEIGGNLYCVISVWNDEIKQWVSREDVGTESREEKEKGQASDAFKRTAVNFGPGRELYSKGCKNVSIFMEQNEVYKNSKGKWNFSFGVSFYVSNIESTDGKVTKLEIKDQNHKVRYTYPNSNTVTPEQPKQRQTTKKSNHDGDPKQHGTTNECADCGTTVKETVLNYSKQKYGKPLCFDCQKKQ